MNSKSFKKIELRRLLDNEHNQQHDNRTRRPHIASDSSTKNATKNSADAPADACAGAPGRAGPLVVRAGGNVIIINGSVAESATIVIGGDASRPPARESQCPSASAAPGSATPGALAAAACRAAKRLSASVCASLSRLLADIAAALSAPPSEPPRNLSGRANGPAHRAHQAIAPPRPLAIADAPVNEKTGAQKIGHPSLFSAPIFSGANATASVPFYFQTCAFFAHSHLKLCEIAGPKFPPPVRPQTLVSQASRQAARLFLAVAVPFQINSSPIAQAKRPIIDWPSA